MGMIHPIFRNTSAVMVVLCILMACTSAAHYEGNAYDKRRGIKRKHNLVARPEPESPMKWRKITKSSKKATKGGTVIKKALLFVNGTYRGFMPHCEDLSLGYVQEFKELVELLKNAGFSTLGGIDTGLKDMIRLQDVFVKALKKIQKDGNVADIFIYYSGHGYSSREGSRYVYACDSSTMFSIDHLLNLVKPYTRVKVVFLDSCASYNDSWGGVKHHGGVTCGTRFHNYITCRRNYVVCEKQREDALHTQLWENTLILGAEAGTILASNPKGGSYATRAFLDLVKDRSPLLDFAATGIQKRIRELGFNEPKEKPSQSWCRRFADMIGDDLHGEPLYGSCCFTTVKNTMNYRKFGEWSFWYDK